MVKLDDLLFVYYKSRKNKRRSFDSVRFELDLESNLKSLCDRINSRTVDTSGNYAFVVTYPKHREIFATIMENRILHHYIDWRLRDIYEKVLSDRSFNNREGKGLHLAISTFQNDVREMSENYTNDAWIFHLDLKGYFPNADVEIALNQQLKILDEFYDGDDKEDLRYMLQESMTSDPARNCKVFVPRECWNCIAPEKSLFNKPVGVGAAIGFLCWQNAMGMYINDIVKWLQTFNFMRVVVFVDDIYIVSRDKKRFLDLMPELRHRLSLLKVNLNEKKFYCQHFSKGVMCLGTMLKFDRMYTNNTSYSRALNKIDNLKKSKSKPSEVLCSLNSHVGNIKKKNQERRLSAFVEKALKKFRKILSWNETRRGFNLKKKDKFFIHYVRERRAYA